MKNRQEFDLVIVGNGAIGNAIALYFSAKHPGAKVGLVGPFARPGCASLAAGAMLNVFAELEEGALDYPTARKKFDAAVESTHLWASHLELLNSQLKNIVPVTINQGTYVVANARTDKFDDLNFRAIIGYLKEYKQAFREVDPREIEGIQPEPQSRPLRAILIENEGTVASKQLHRAYDEAFSSSPDVFPLDAEVKSIEPRGKLKIIKTHTGLELAAPLVVLAAGARTQEFVEQLGLERRIPRIVNGVGVAVILKSQPDVPVPKRVFRTPNRGLACGIYVVPYADNYCYIGATNYVCPWEVPLPRVQAVHYLLAAAMEQVNTGFYKAEIHKTIVGYRPTTMDTYPLFGQTSIEGVWIATGTKRDGFHLSPKIAVEFVQGIESGKQPFAGAFVPERNLILEVPRETLIERAVSHIISTGYQHGFKLPHSNWDPILVDGLRRKVLDAYEKCGLENCKFGIPPELLDMYRYGHAKHDIERLLEGGA